MEGIHAGSARLVWRPVAHQEGVDFYFLRIRHCVSHHLMHRVGMLIEATFSLCIVLFLTIPRAPNFKFPSADIIGVDNSTVSFSRSPTNFSFAGSVNMIGTFATGYFVIPGVNPSALPADSTSSYLPVYFTNLDITVKDLTTNKEIATGNWRNQKLKRGDAEFVSLPVQFSYTGVNTSDTTCEFLSASGALTFCSRFAIQGPICTMLVGIFGQARHVKVTRSSNRLLPLLIAFYHRYPDRGDAPDAHQRTCHGASLLEIHNGYRLSIRTSV
jgi:hypothetical protein